MAGYWDTKKLIIDTLVGRPVGTLIFPEGHQNFALSLLDYIRSVEVLGASSLQGVAEQDTVPVQPDNARICYIATVPPNRFYTFENFRDENGQPIQVVSGLNTITFCTLLWNGEYWSVQTTQMYSGDQGGPQVGIRDLLTSGTTIGVLTIDGVDYTLKAPAGGGGGGSSVAIRDLLATGTTIGILTIDGIDYTLKAPSGGSGSYILGNELTGSPTQGILKGVIGFTKNGTISENDSSMIEWDQINGAWHFKGNLYADGWISDGGIGSGGGGGGSTVSIRDLLTEGTTIGILTIDGVDYTLKAPAGGGGGSVTVVDNLTTDSPTDALSANQGRLLKSYIDGGYVFKGFATCSTTPPARTPYPVCYIGVESGHYVDFYGNPLISLQDGQVVFLSRRANRDLWDIAIYTISTGSGGGGGSSTLAGLTDVSLSGSLSNGQYLTYNSSLNKWINSIPPSISNLWDVRLTNLQTGQFLGFDGSHWVNMTPQGGGGSTVSWGIESGNTVPLSVDGVSKTLLLSGALSGYATQSWVQQQSYITNESDPTVPSWAKQSSLQFSALPAAYVGSTAIQSSKAVQSLTGISSIKATLDTNSETTSLFEWDSDKSAWHFHGNLYADGWISEGGIGSSSGGGGVDLDRVWASLTNSIADTYANTKIDIAHIPDITTSKITNLESWISGKNYITASALNGYATQSWVQQQNYITVSALTGYATESWVQQQNYVPQSRKINGVDLSQDRTLYLGTTTLQTSSGAQAVTGILSIKNATNDSLFEWDSANSAWRFHGNLYADGWIADGGIGSSGGGSGIDLDRMWDSLTNSVADAYANTKIDLLHIPDITTSKITNLESWISGKNYITASAIPTELKNPYALTFGNDSYDGSVAKTITAASLGAITQETDPTVPSWAKDASLAFSSLPALYALGTQITNTATQGTLLRVSALSNAAASVVGSDDSRIEWDSQRSAWHVYGNFYTDGWNAAGGVQ